jgi:hypothetical protein
MSDGATYFSMSVPTYYVCQNSAALKRSKGNVQRELGGRFKAIQSIYVSLRRPA